MTSRLAALLAVLALLAGCGGNGSGGDEAAATAPRPATTAGEASSIRVGLVTDVGGLDDRSFNFLANKGLERAESELGVEGRVLASRANADYVPNLSRLAREGYDLVIAVGPLMADAVDTVAKQFPDVDFAIVDVDQEQLKSKPRNVRGLLFEEEEAGYLVGYLAGLVTKHEAGSKQVIGSVGGMKIPPVDRYIAGYRAGARKANPQIVTLNSYSHDFVDQAKCKEVALDQIANGSGVVFQVAGQCGLGALDAAKEKAAFGIGVDADQGYLGTHIMTSALKRVDVAVYSAISAAKAGTLKVGINAVFSAKLNGVGYGKVSPRISTAIKAKVAAQLVLLKAGKIKGIPQAVK